MLEGMPTLILDHTLMHAYTTGLGKQPPCSIIQDCNKLCFRLYLHFDFEVLLEQGMHTTQAQYYNIRVTIRNLQCIMNRDSTNL